MCLVMGRDECTANKEDKKEQWNIHHQDTVGFTESTINT